MEIKNSDAKSIKLTEKEKDILDKAFNLIDRLDYEVLDYLIIDREKMYTAKDVANTLSLLENLIDADRIIAG